MKVTFIIQKLAGLKGGAERVLCDIASALSERGYEVEVLTYERHSGAPGYDLPNAKITNVFPFQKASLSVQTTRPRYRLEAVIKAVPDVPPLGRIKWALTYEQFTNRVEAHLRKSKADVLVGLLPAGVIAASMCGQRLGIPSVASIHSAPRHDFGDGGRWDPNPIFRRARREALRHADRILVLQPDFIRELPEPLREKTKVMPNPVLQGKPVPNLARSREKLVIGVGRLVKSKRYDLLVSAWAQLAERFPDWRVEIYGEGPERDYMSKLIAERNLESTVFLKGATDDVAAVYERAEIMCHPSEFEGFGLSVAEALSHRVPVIANASCSGANTLIRDGISGLLVQENSECGWTEAISHLLSDAGLRESLGSAGHGDMKSLARDHVAKLWDDMLRELAQDAN